VVVRSEVLGLQPPEVSAAPAGTGCWLEFPVHVVEDSDAQLVTYTAPGAPFRFPPGPWPTPDGLHPWFGRDAWTGHGCLMVQRPGDHNAVWHFWEGPERSFVCWYLNLQTSFTRTETGYQTQDLELDLLVFPDGSHLVKDADVLDDRITEGRYTPELVRWIRAYGDGLVDRLVREGPWWDRSWADWTPDAAWAAPIVTD
jgi:hypothetical protein